MGKKIIVGSRKSRLAMAQTQTVVERLAKAWPGHRFQIVPISTSGDQVQTAQGLRTLGKGVFVKEIESALLRRRIDLAVHSLKDMPTALPPGLKLSAMLEREDSSDVFIGRAPTPLEKLPPRSKIGTSSYRRRAFLYSHYPHLAIEELRGNLDTRIEKMLDPKNGLAGIVVAAAGIRRLFPAKFKHFVQPIPLGVLPPAPGQGILGIETRDDNRRVNEIVAAVNHEPTYLCGQAERSILRRLQGGCNVPIAALAEMQGSLLKLTCWIANLDGTRVIQESTVGTPEDADQVSMALEIMLKSRGAADLIDEIRMQIPWAKAAPSANGHAKPAKPRRATPRRARAGRKSR